MKLTRSQLEQLIDGTSLNYKGTDLIGICPYCNSPTKEFGISLNDNHVFNCYRKKECGKAGNLYTLLKYLGRTKEFLSERQINVFEKLESNIDNVQELDSILPEITAPLFWKRVSDNDYLRERGFWDYQFDKFEVGISRIKKDYVTFLVRREEKLIGHVTRSMKSKVWIDAYNQTQKEIGSKITYLRYDNSTTDFAKTLFGYDEIIEGKTQDVILVEGIFSKTKTDVNLGLDFQDEIKCCATFGAKLSDHQILLLKNKGVTNLIFWFEEDVLNKIKPIIAKASLYFNVRASYLKGVDPNEIDQDRAFDLLEKSKNWLDFNTSYIKSNLKA